jgi:SAM-dependent methyltransferase
MDKGRYTQFHDHCSVIERRFGRQGHLPLKPLDLNVLRCKNLLDFGAGKGLNANICENYFTFDADKTLNPSFTEFSQIESNFFESCIANQVFEHIELDSIDDVVNSLHRVLKPGGTIVITVPNVHRGTYYFNDIDHKTPLMYYHVASFLELNGFEVIDAYRYTKNHFAIANADVETKKIMNILETFYELDPAQFLAVVATKGVA